MQKRMYQRSYQGALNFLSNARLAGSGGEGSGISGGGTGLHSSVFPSSISNTFEEEWSTLLGLRCWAKLCCRAIGRF